jgi:predicted nucleotidyltransferase
VRRVALFGSTAWGDASPDSDVDLILEFDKGRKTVDALTPEAFDDRRKARIRSEAVYFEIKS